MLIIIVPPKLRSKFCVQQFIVYSLQQQQQQQQQHIFLLHFDARELEKFIVELPWS